MCLKIPDIRVGEPTVCGGVAVFPLFSERSLFGVDYILADEAMQHGTLAVTEVSEEGMVGTLLAANEGDQPVLFVEGEELTGAKQNRVLGESVLIPAKTRTRIPVCCVQRGKWAYSTRQFKAGSCCPPTLRHLLKQGMPGRPFDSQAAVWREICRKHWATGTHSEKENLSDALDTHRGAVDALRRALPYVEGASGLAIAIGAIVSVDVFDLSTCRRVWGRFVEGLVLDALEVGATDRLADGKDISVRLYRMSSVRWEQVPTVGLGEAFRAQDEGALATALVLDGALVHLSLSISI